MGRICAPPHREPKVYDDLTPGAPPGVGSPHRSLPQPQDPPRPPVASVDYRRRVRARLLELRDPLRQSWNDLWLRRLDAWSPASNLQQTCHLCGDCGTVSFAAPKGAYRYAQCSQVAACPWPQPPAGPRRRTE